MSGCFSLVGAAVGVGVLIFGIGALGPVGILIVILVFGVIVSAGDDED